MKIILNGALGKMGRSLTKFIGNSEKNILVAAMIDKKAFPDDGIYSDINDFGGSADVIIDFSNHSACENLLKYAVEYKIPVVIATTGHTDCELQLIKDSAEKIPVFFSSNMSLGIAALCRFTKCLSSLFPDANIEIVETHHNSKKDSPSGTALTIAEEIKSVRPASIVNCARCGVAIREENEIGIHSIRLANVVGEHEVIISNGRETMRIKHEAHSRSLYAEGAIAAAEFIQERKSGLFSVKDIIKL